MNAREILAICYERGLRPRIGEGGRLEVSGGSGLFDTLTPALEKVVYHPAHLEELTRLVAVGWTPPTLGDSGRKPLVDEPPPVLGGGSAEPAAFDWEAERAVRDLYGVGCGLKWRPCGMEVLRRGPHNPAALDAVLRRIAPLRDRVEKHVRPRDALTVTPYGKAGSHVVDFLSAPDREGREVPWRRFLPIEDYPHVFDAAPPYGYTHWRYHDDEASGYWRAIWGRVVRLESGRSAFVPWGL